MLRESLASVLSLSDGDVEVLLRVDNDDEASISAAKSLSANDHRIAWKSGNRGRGYRDLHVYLDELSAMASGGWLFLWNDDARIVTNKWDDTIRVHGNGCETVAVLFSGLFPILSRKAYEIVGSWATNCHVDSWWGEIGDRLGIKKAANLQIQHWIDLEPLGLKASDIRDHMHVYDSDAFNSADTIAIRESHIGKLSTYIAQHGTRR